MNKRGMGWGTAIGILVGVIFFIAVISSKMSGGIIGFFKGQNYDIAVKNLDELSKTMNVELGESGFSYLAGHRFFLPSGYIIVGFGKDEDSLKDECQIEIVKKPRNFECDNKSCLCLYKESMWSDDDFVNNAPMMCRKINANKIFTLDYYSGNTRYNAASNIYKNILGGRIEIESSIYPDDYASLFIYGQCDDWASDELLGNTNLYVERVEKNGEVFVFLSDLENGKVYSSRLSNKNQDGGNDEITA